jgi:hypothetical protein
MKITIETLKLLRTAVAIATQQNEKSFTFQSKELTTAYGSYLVDYYEAVADRLPKKIASKFWSQMTNDEHRRSVDGTLPCWVVEDMTRLTLCNFRLSSMAQAMLISMCAGLYAPDKPIGKLVLSAMNEIELSAPEPELFEELKEGEKDC